VTHEYAGSNVVLATTHSPEKVGIAIVKGDGSKHCLSRLPQTLEAAVLPVHFLAQYEAERAAVAKTDDESTEHVGVEYVSVQLLLALAVQALPPGILNEHSMRGGDAVDPLDQRLYRRRVHGDHQPTWHIRRLGQ
jgi:hypothetical protein